MDQCHLKELQSLKMEWVLITIFQKRGFTDSANKNGVFILQPNGETIKVKV